MPESKQPNARLQQSGFLQEFYWRPAPGQQLAIHVWLQQSEREIPPTTVLNISRASQADRFARTALNWRVVRGNVVWQARAGLFRENLHYRDEQIRLSSFTQFWTAMGEIEGEWFINERQRLQYSASHTWLQAQAGAYKEPPRQNRTAQFASFRQQVGSWQLQGSLRYEAVDMQTAPPFLCLNSQNLYLCRSYNHFLTKPNLQQWEKEIKKPKKVKSGAGLTEIPAQRATRKRTKGRRRRKGK